ncbi:class I SAM-dependent methyltransferase [Candidatus Uhrbacteria bacterium]|nr:class I SAM-dependent methyltransferase [Candidatus Uhrbacteria bacterium]
MFNARQKVQEDEYKIPYHWSMRPDTFNGRVYFGYLSICLEFLKKYLNGRESPRALDAGCGDGRFLSFLKEGGASEIFGADYSERALSFAKILAPAAELVQADLTQALPFPEKYFDVIFFIETLEHIAPEKIPMVLDNLKRVLKDNGRLIITVPSTGMPISLHHKHYQHFTPASLQTGLAAHFRVEEMLGQDKAGFHILNFLYKFLDNRFWTLKGAASRYNSRLWPKFFNRAPLRKCRRLIAVCEKNN